ncbi:MAG: hypothetical protein PF961_05765 [Planctomycetota bacterium]|jgi:uncharacterized membrane protein YdbT with pleckstrin-like domain|nr:hypothetical protein [Planctomycetota bacterium]
MEQEEFRRGDDDEVFAPPDEHHDDHRRPVRTRRRYGHERRSNGWDTVIDVVAYVRIAFSLLAIVLAVLFGAFIAFIAANEGANSRVDPAMFGVILAVLGLILLLPIAGIWISVAVLRRRTYGKVLGYIVSVLSLFDIPIGTAMGIMWLIAFSKGDRSWR